MNGIPIQTQSKKDYYYIQFHPDDVEWLYLMTKLLDAIEVRAWNDYFISQVEETGEVIYVLKKERFSPALIAEHLGISATIIQEQIEAIHLERIPSTGLPKPNVKYWGTA